ncbi:hypothetical protein B296_00044083 [Ensete ventricosum]|uniref:Uncharacterized protein n=1 Tax=Ensete ventricosum TaxID=4639 RepID=A0A426ZCB2_ENSVE|nr:hypothetical protein B296_00044083 [Ensete ventricosum]
MSGLVRPCSAPNAVPTLACKVAAAGHGGRCSYYVVGESTQRSTVTYARAARRAQRLAAEEEDINEVADAFIRRFREDLHLESIDNYNQMLARGL